MLYIESPLPIRTTDARMETAPLPHLVPGRACGTCMMCCKIPAIEEFAKPPGVWCRHAVSGKGCAIYADRPGCCRAFYCSWMQDASFGPEWKPEKSKFVVYWQRNGANLQIAVDPSFPNAWTRPPYHARIRGWVAERAERGQFVFVRIGMRMIALLPDRDVDLGRVEGTDEIVVSRQPGPAGLAYGVEVKRAAETTEAAGAAAEVAQAAVDADPATAAAPPAASPAT
jgi:hypothetical protein